MAAELPNPYEPADARVTGERDGIAKFIDTYYTSKQRDAYRLGRIEDSARTPGMMAPTTRAVVMIPAHFSEMNLDRTLREYAKQDIFDRHANGSNISCEVAVLVNNKQGDATPLPDTPAYQAALGFKEACPQLPVVVAYASYLPHEATIGRIRRDLAALEIKRALDMPEVDADNLVLITNDADLQRIPTNYISSVIRSFDDNPQQAGITGFIDYPKEDFDADHVFHVVQRYNDILDIIRRRRDGRMTMHAGNSAFRLRDYVEAGGIRNSKAAELLPLYNALRLKDPSSIAYGQRGDGMTIVTSARRQLTANQQGVAYVDRYRHFGEEDDLADAWKKPETTFTLPEYGMKYTNKHFFREMQSQLNAVYAKAVSVSPDDMERIQAEMRLAGVLSGIRLRFVKVNGDKIAQRAKQNRRVTEHEVEVLDMAKLMKAMKQKHNRY